MKKYTTLDSIKAISDIELRDHILSVLLTMGGSEKELDEMLAEDCPIWVVETAQDIYDELANNFESPPKDIWPPRHPMVDNKLPDTVFWPKHEKGEDGVYVEAGGEESPNSYFELCMWTPQGNWLYTASEAHRNYAPLIQYIPKHIVDEQPVLQRNIKEAEELEQRCSESSIPVVGNSTGFLDSDKLKAAFGLEGGKPN